ncbi:MAG: DsbA family protein [Solirubrobacterales bacterium]
MSGRRARGARHEQGLDGEGRAGPTERRQRLIKLGSAAAFLAVVVVAVLIVVSAGNSGGDPENVKDASSVSQALDGIPQHGLVLGELDAPVTLFEYGDLQCPACKGYAEEVLPQIIENQVRDGEAKLSFNNFPIIGPQSTPAGAAAVAAGEQGRGWHFIELFYRNQGAENSGYATDRFLTAIARRAGVPDIARWNEERKSKRVSERLEWTTFMAEEQGLSGTPSFFVLGPYNNDELRDPVETTGSAKPLEAAMAEAAANPG